MADNRTGNVIKNSAASMIQKFVQIIVQFALRTAFIRILGNEYTGISGLFTDILQVLSLMELGLDSSMIFSLYDPLARKDKRRIAALLKFYKTAFTVIGFLVLTSGIACTPFLLYIVKGVPNITEDIRLIFLMYVLASALSYFVIYKSVLLRADQKSRVISIWTSIIYVIECVVEIVLLIVFRRFFAYLIVYLLATLARNIIISGISSRMYPEYFEASDARLTKGEKRKLYKDLACLTVYNLSGVVINSTDSVFISAFIGTVEVAIITNYTMIINGLRMAVSQIVNATKPSIGNLAATSSNNKQELIFKRMNFISFWATCFCCTCLFTLLNPFIGNIWFNPDYEISMKIVSVLVANFFIAVMVFPVESFRTANGLFVQGWMRPAFMAVLNIVLDFIWGKAFGIFGIFIATTVSRLLTQVWYDPWLIYKNVFRKGVVPYYLLYLMYAAITALSCVLSFYICMLVVKGSGLLAFLLKAIISMLVPNLIIVLLFGRTEEFNYIKNLALSFGRKIAKRG